MVSAVGPAAAASGHNRKPTASERNLDDAHVRLLRIRNGMLYLGGVDKPAKAIRSGTGARRGKSRREFMNELQTSGKTHCVRVAETGKPVVRRSRREWPARPCRNDQEAPLSASGTFQTANPRVERSRQ